MNRKDFLTVAGAAMAAPFASTTLAANTSAPQEPWLPQGDNKLPIFKFNLDKDGALLVDNKGGSARAAKQSINFPALQGITMYSVHLEKGGLREPHWHPNAHELSYLVSGKVRIAILDGEDNHYVYDVNPGEITFIPTGYFHYIQNIADGDSFLVIAFSNANPEDTGLSGAVGLLTNDLLGQTFGIKPDIFNAVPKPAKSAIIVPPLG